MSDNSLEDAPDSRVTDRRRLSSIVAQEITQWIFNGKLKTGDSLPSEAELTKRFKVSKPTLREAVDKLSVMGIVKVQQGKPAAVNPLNSHVLEGFFRYAVQLYPEGLRDMLELRRGVETETAGLAAERIGREHGDKLMDLAARMRSSLNSTAEYLDADYNFHLTLAEASSNKLLLQTFFGITEQVQYTQRICYLQRDLKVAEHTIQVHLEVAQSVVEGDPERARHAMYMHFENMMPFVGEIMGNKSRHSDIF